MKSVTYLLDEYNQLRFTFLYTNLPCRAKIS